MQNACVFISETPHRFFPCSGGQHITIMGRNFDVIDSLIILPEPKDKNVSLQLLCRDGYFQGRLCFHRTKLC